MPNVEVSRDRRRGALAAGPMIEAGGIAAKVLRRRKSAQPPGYAKPQRCRAGHGAAQR